MPLEDRFNYLALSNCHLAPASEAPCHGGVILLDQFTRLTDGSSTN